MPAGGTSSVATTNTPSVSISYTYTPVDTWAQLATGTTSGEPPASMGSAMAYDGATGQQLLFGGYNSSGGGSSFQGTWSWNGSQWAVLAPASSPSARAFTQTAYDPATHQLVLFGGQDNTAFYGGTYLWDGSNWSKALAASATDTATTPSNRAFGAIAYDPASQQLVLFGGQYDTANGPVAYGGTWTWNGSTWSKLAPATSPSARYGASMAYDAATGTLVLFGGTTGQPGSFGGTWSWNGTTWAKLSSSGPSPRFGASMVYDPALGQVLLFGGTTESVGNTGTISYPMYGGTWAWDGSAWAKLAPAASPASRFAAAMAYDPATGQPLLFGGSTSFAGAYRQGTWDFQTAPGAPTSVTASPGDQSAYVAWAAPPNGGTAITSYTVTPSPGCASCSGLTVIGNPAATHTAVSGLTNGTSYTFTVTATNIVSSGGPSSSSNAVVPAVPGAIQAPTTTMFTSSDVLPASPTSGQPATFTATVRPTSGGGTPTGAVTFDATPAGSSSATDLCTATLPSSGTASCSATLSSAGSPYSVTAVYSGDANFTGSTSSPAVGVTVRPASPTTTTFTSSDVSPASPTSGQPVSFTAAVRSSSGSGTPTGTVAFDATANGSTSPTALCTAQVSSSGIASCQATLSSTGSPYSVTATYSGSNSFAASTSSPPVTVTVQPSPTPSQPVTAPTGQGYFEVASDGGIFTFGDAAFHGSMGGKPLNAPVVGMAIDPATGGYWEVAADGGVFSFDAPFYGSMGGKPLNKPVVAMAATPNGGGYWLVAQDGGVFTFGDAGFYGSMGGKLLNKPVVGMAATPNGGGYWLVAQDGGVFTFGDAGFYGSSAGVVSATGGTDTVDLAPAPDGKGYWLVSANGAVGAFGDAHSYGSAASYRLNAPVVGMASTPNGRGYWEVASDGGIFTFGNAGFYGSMGGKPLNKPVVGMAVS